MNQRSHSGSTSTSAMTPNGSAAAAASDTGATSRQLHCGIACSAKGSAQIVSISSSVGAAVRGP